MSAITVKLRVGAQVQIGGLHAVVQPAGSRSICDHLGLGKHVPAVDGVVVEA